MNTHAISSHKLGVVLGAFIGGALGRKTAMKQRVRTVFEVAAGVLVLVGTAAGTAWAQPRTPHGPTVGPAIYKMVGYDGGLALPFLLRAVNLTPDQQTKVRGSLPSHQTGSVSPIEHLQQAEDEFAAKLLSAPIPIARPPAARTAHGVGALSREN